jgi:hypothetical protein
MQDVYNIIKNSEMFKNMEKVHFIFVKRYYEKVFSTLR